MPVFRHVNRSNIKLAGLASLYSNMRKLFRDIHRQLLLVLFTTSRTQDSPELPLISAKRTNHVALSPVAFQPQHSIERPSPAQRASLRRRQHWGYRRPLRKVPGVRLQKRAWEKLRKCPDLLIEHSAQFPIGRQKCDPRFG